MPEREKCEAFRVQLKAANKGVDVGDEQLWKFLKCFHLLGFDLDITSGVTLSLLNSHIAQFKCGDVVGVWAKITKEVAFSNQNAGTLTLETISKEIKTAFSEHAPVSHIPKEFLKKAETQDSADFSKGKIPTQLRSHHFLALGMIKRRATWKCIKRLFE